MLNAKSVQQVLDVLLCIEGIAANGEPLRDARHKATQTVAQRQTRPIRYQTVEDLYRRRLGLKTVSEFDDFVQEWANGHPENLSRLLLEHSDPTTRDTIMQFFREHTCSTPRVQNRSNDQITGEKVETIEVALTQNEADTLRYIAKIRGVELAQLLSQTVAQALRSELKMLAQRGI